MIPYQFKANRQAKIDPNGDIVAWACDNGVIKEVRIPFEVWDMPKPGCPFDDDWHGNCFAGRATTIEKALELALKESRNFTEMFWSI